MTPQAIRDGFEHLRTRQADAAAGRRRALPLRGRLAGRHQRHARDDGVQLARRRLLPDHRRPGADADAVDRGRARGEDPQARHARLLGGHARPSRPRPASTTASGSTRSGRRTPTTPSCAPTASGTSATRRRSPTRCAASRPRHRGGQADHAGAAAAVRPDHAAARGQLALRLLRQDHAVDRAGAVREAQGADLSADRQPRTCPRTTCRSSRRRWR